MSTCLCNNTAQLQTLCERKVGPTIDSSERRQTCKCLHSMCVCVCARARVSTCLQKGAKVLDGKGNRLREEREKKRKPRMDGRTAGRRNNVPRSQSRGSELKPFHIRQSPYTSRHWWECWAQGARGASRGRNTAMPRCRWHTRLCVCEAVIFQQCSGLSGDPAAADDNTSRQEDNTRGKSCRFS